MSKSAENYTVVNFNYSVYLQEEKSTILLLTEYTTNTFWMKPQKFERIE